jgi:hypothetical protein
MGRALNTATWPKKFWVKIFRLIDTVGKKENIKKGRKKWPKIKKQWRRGKKRKQKKISTLVFSVCRKLRQLQNFNGGRTNEFLTRTLPGKVSAYRILRLGEDGRHYNTFPTHKWQLSCLLICWHCEKGSLLLNICLWI